MSSSSTPTNSTNDRQAFTFALYFSEAKSKQMCQFLDDYPFANADGSLSEGRTVPGLGLDTRIRGVKMIIEDEEATKAASSASAQTQQCIPRISFVDNNGSVVDPSHVHALLQKASVDRDNGREDRLSAIQTFCDAHGIRIVDPLSASMDICASRTYVARTLAGGAAGDGMPHFGRTAIEMLDYWGFLIPSTYRVVVNERDASASAAIQQEVTRADRQGSGAEAPVSSRSLTAVTEEVLFEEPNPSFKTDVVVVKPEVASQRNYSHDLLVVRTEDFMADLERRRYVGGGQQAIIALPAKAEGCSAWVVQDCLSRLALPVVFKVYVAGEYLSVMVYDAQQFNREVVEKVSNGEACGLGMAMDGGSKTLFQALETLADRRAFQDVGPLQAESIAYFAKGTRNYDDLWQTVQFLKRPEHLGVNFFGMDVLVVKSIDGQRDRRYIVDVNYLPSYKNETPARLFPAFLRAMMDVHQ